MKRRMLAMLLCLAMGACLFAAVPVFAAQGETKDVLSDRMVQLAANGGYVEEWYPDQKTCLVNVGGTRNMDNPYRIENLEGETLLQGYADMWRTDNGYARIGYYVPGTMDPADNVYEAMSDPAAVDAYAELYDFDGNLVEQTKLSGGYDDWFVNCGRLYPRSYDYYLDTSALYAEGGYAFASDKVSVEPIDGGFSVTDASGEELGQVFIPDAEALAPFLSGNLLGFYKEESYGYSIVRWYYLDI